MLIQVTDFYRFWKLSKIDALVWLITFLTVLFISIDSGLFVGLLMSVITIIYLGFKPYTCLLGSVPHTDIYLDITRYKMANELEGIKIFHYRGGINFASRNTFKSELCRLVGINPQQELIMRRKLAKIEAAEELSGSNVFIQKLSNKVEKLKKKTKTDLKCLIVDFSAVSYIDPSGVSMIKLLGEDFHRIDVPVYVAGCCGPVYEMMKKCNVVNDKKNLIRIFPTIHDAVQSASTIFDVNSYSTISVITK
ncbi:hypothetical protein ILUMI_17711 [Ignelater luminosus]|uniref:STAS domain-containing protein n=1 Tax=Ignelater luminosus TaxID=2038154 RepID=A0A8K0G4T7_IGNLU|nr:hypothetical protein ILUMI_17711 [Ignelater luminosus]